MQEGSRVASAVGTEEHEHWGYLSVLPMSGTS